MPTLEINLHPHQIEIYNDPRRFKIIRAGRRFGKSRLASRAIIVKALETPGGMYFIVAPVVAQTGIIWREITKFLPKELIAKQYIGDRRIILKNGANLWARSGDNPDTLRGEGLDGCILDEAAMLRKDVWTEAIRPALADKMGWCWMISTPKGKNWFYKEYMKGISTDPKYADYAGFHYTSYDNPFLRKSEVDAMAEELPDLAFKQEIMAEFIEGGGMVFQSFIQCIRDDILSEYVPGHIGHSLRRTSSTTKQALDWTPQGSRSVGRPKQTWRRTIESDLQGYGRSWREVKPMAKNRVRWKGLVNALCSLEE